MPISSLWKWAESNPGKTIPLGRIVACDVCGEDYTENTETGGFIFGSYAYCPKCAVDGLQKIKGYGEEHLIKAKCPADKSFADFVRAYRGEDAGIRIN